MLTRVDIYRFIHLIVFLSSQTFVEKNGVVSIYIIRQLPNDDFVYNAKMYAEALS